MNNEKMKENVKKVSDMVNILTFDNKDFCKEMTKEHRALQQSFTDLCIEWLRTCGKEDYKYDARNEWAHVIGKRFIQEIDY